MLCHCDFNCYIHNSLPSLVHFFYTVNLHATLFHCCSYVKTVYNACMCVCVFISALTDLADTICFLLVGSSDLAAKSTVEVFTSVQIFISYLLHLRCKNTLWNLTNYVVLRD